MFGAEHMNGDGLCLRLLGRLALHMPDGDDRNYVLLEHGPAVNESGAAHEMKPVCPLWHPEFHAALGPGSHRRTAMPDLIRIAKVVA